MKIIPVSADLTLQHWHTISVYLEKARQQGQGESSLTDYMRKVLAGVAQCWVILDENDCVVGAGLTEFIQYMQHKTLHVMVYGGSDFAKQSQVFGTIIQYAKDNGCKRIEQWGRKGWAKVLPKYVPQFKEAYTVMSMDLGETNNEEK
jgi:hypothetical protein